MFFLRIGGITSQFNSRPNTYTPRVVRYAYLFKERQGCGCIAARGGNDVGNHLPGCRNHCASAGSTSGG